ncbi:MAG: transposase [Desulfobacteraceae bacterium]|nr:transposase [Desulfobacteraceae bacterium]
MVSVCATRSSASRTLLTFGENTLGGKLGFVATLHTWDQKLDAHFQLHCLVAGGAVSSDGLRWIPCNGNYLFNARAMALMFRGKFMDRMKKACQRQCLKMADHDFNQFKARRYEKPWIVDRRDPVKNLQHVLESLSFPSTGKNPILPYTMKNSM